MENRREGLRVIHSLDDLLSPEYRAARDQLNQEIRKHQKRIEELVRKSMELSYREHFGYGIPPQADENRSAGEPFSKGEKRMLHELEKAIGHSFRDISLLENALAHSSYANERWHNSLRSNERLEFLGDSILGMLVADHLYRNFPDRPEGELTRMRADMVCEQSLALIANRIGLGTYLLLGHGEERFGGRSRNSILADAVESVIAACYLDGGYAAALKFVSTFVLVDIPVVKFHNTDYKTALQEKIQQKKNQTLSYHLVGEEGPDHDKRFRVEVCLNGVSIGTGSGTSKKRAEQDAARAALEGL